jgi:hypothetical protein
MRRYSEAVKVDVRKRMSPPHRESVARIPEELGIHVFTLYNSSYWNDTRAPRAPRLSHFWNKIIDTSQMSIRLTSGVNLVDR